MTENQKKGTSRVNINTGESGKQGKTAGTKNAASAKKATASAGKTGTSKASSGKAKASSGRTKTSSGKTKASSGKGRTSHVKASSGSGRSRTSSRKSSSAKKQTGRRTGSNKGRQGEQGIPMSNEILLIASFGIFLIMMFSNFGCCGTVGKWLAGFCFGIFGCAQYAMPVAFFLGMTILIANDYSTLAMKKCGAGFIILMAVSAFAQLLYKGKDVTVHDLFALSIDNHAAGGVIGGGVGILLKNGFGTAGAMVILFCIMLMSLVLLTQRSFVAFFKSIVDAVRNNYAAWQAESEKRREAREKSKKEAAGEDISQEKEIRLDGEESSAGGAGSFLKMKSGRKRSKSADKLRAKQCEEKVKELESRNKENKENKEKQEEKDPLGDIKIHVPLFTSSDEVKRKDNVRELHPKIYPFTEEDGKSEPFKGELDFSAFSLSEQKDGTEEPESAVVPEEADFQDDLYGDLYGDLHNGLQENLQDGEQFVPPHKGIGGFETASSLPDEIVITREEVKEYEPEEAEEYEIEDTIETLTAGDEPVEALETTVAESVEEAGSGETVEIAESEPPVKTEAAAAQAADPVELTAAASATAAATATKTTSAGQSGSALASETPAARAGSAPTIETPTARAGSALAAEMPAAGAKSAQQPASGQGKTSCPDKKKVPDRKKAGKAEYIYPPYSLLVREEQKMSPDYDRHLRETAQKLQQTLESFGVKVTITDISCGPTVTRYEMFPEQGTKVSKIVSLTDDIKLNLAASDIRIEAPIPGKAAIGIEVPNKQNMTVHLRDLVESRTFKKSKSRLAFAVGKDIGGKTVVADLAKMPHLLIAGATGSGKSVCINTLIMSLLYKSSPEDVKLIMIDPKMVELSIYNGIPHLLIPVVTDPKKASGALNWAVAEMTHRYRKFTETGVRNIEGYNKKVKELIADGQVGEDDLKKMPQIVIIVDELADLMMVAPGEVEDAIVRLSQLARAAGIHLVIATQRPSVNVITGLIKANVPSRIAFSVSSGVDSRTIIDMNGAEKLLGKGDMLFYPAGYQKPVRVQGAFVSDKEISHVVEFLKENEDIAVYDAEVTENIETKLKNNAVSQERDEYFEAAARFIMEKDKATIGMLQRMFKIGFNRAARIIDQLADAGIVGPEEGTKPRKILMSPEQLDAFFEENL